MIDALPGSGHALYALSTGSGTDYLAFTRFLPLCAGLGRLSLDGGGDERWDSTCGGMSDSVSLFSNGGNGVSGGETNADSFAGTVVALDIICDEFAVPVVSVGDTGIAGCRSGIEGHVILSSASSCVVLS